jgi:hypothetical protein
VADYVNMGLEAKKLKASGGNFTWSKGVNALINYTANKHLAFNLFSGVNEILQGWSSVFMEAASGRYFSTKEAVESMGLTFRAAAPDSKLSRLGHGFGAHVDRASLDNFVGNKITKVSFGLWEFANRTTNMTYLGAMLKHEKVTDKNGVEHSLFDVLDMDHDFKYKLDGDFDDILYTPEGELSRYMLDLQHKFKEIIKNNRERQTFEDPAEIDKTTIGRILGQFKKGWFFSAIQARFGEHQDLNLMSGYETEGYYKTFFKQFALPKIKDEYGDEVYDYSPRGFRTMFSHVLKTIARYSSIGRHLGVEAGANDSELTQANLRKFMREIGIATTMTICVAILSSMGGDGDDDPLRKYFLNQLIRIERDTTMYMSPASLASELKNPAPLVSTVSDFFSIGTAMIRSGIMMDPYTHTPGHEELRIWKATKKNIPYLNQYDKTMSKFDKTMQYIGY